MVFSDILFPKFCLGCGFIGVYLCPDCQKDLSPLKKDECIYCGKKSLYGLTHPACKKIHGIDGALSIFHYNPLLKTLIKEIKYRLATQVWSELSLLIKPSHLYKLAYLKNSKSAIFIQPIPLYIEKERQRGFNQAFLLSQFFKQYLEFPILDILKRKKETYPQAQVKNGKERQINIAGAFELTDTTLVKGKQLLLIDDVLTSGATTIEAAYILKKAGARKVFVLTLAKG